MKYVSLPVVLSGFPVILKSVRTAVIMSCMALSLAAQDNAEFRKLILDAQEKNIAKFRSGTMNALVTRSFKDRGTAKMEMRIQWDASTRYWEYRLNDPDGILHKKGNYARPLEEAPAEHMLMTGKTMITTHSNANYVLVQAAFPAGQLYGGFEYFEITPDPLWKVCCLPYTLSGRTWKELLEKPFVRPSSKDEIRFEQLDGGIIRLSTRNPASKFSAIYEFSLPLAGNLVRYESQTDGSPDKYWSVTNEWVKEGDVVRLVRAKMLMGGKNDATAANSLEIQVRSMQPQTGKVPMTLEKIVALMPKNARVVDHIKN